MLDSLHYLRLRLVDWAYSGQNLLLDVQVVGTNHFSVALFYVSIHIQ